MKKIIDVIIEIPKNSNVKYEYNRATKQIAVDRILYGPDMYPENYGFIPSALDWDGDELDVLVIADQPFSPGIAVPTRIIGAMHMIDDGETDTKLIGVIACDPRYQGYEKLSDIPAHKLAVIREFFETYKHLQNKVVKVGDFEDAEWAEKELDACTELMQKYGKLPKEEFLAKMKQEHPEKYR